MGLTGFSGGIATQKYRFSRTYLKIRWYLDTCELRYKNENRRLKWKIDLIWENLKKLKKKSQSRNFRGYFLKILGDFANSKIFGGNFSISGAFRDFGD